MTDSERDSAISSGCNVRLPQVDRVDERGTALCDISCLFGLRHEVSIVSNSTSWQQTAMAKSGGAKLSNQIFKTLQECQDSRK